MSDKIPAPHYLLSRTVETWRTAVEAGTSTLEQALWFIACAATDPWCIIDEAGLNALDAMKPTKEAEVLDADLPF